MTNIVIQPRLLLSCVLCFCVLLLSWCHLWEDNTISAQPLPQEQIAQFYERGIFDPQQISEDDLRKHFESTYYQEKDPDQQKTLAKRLLTLKWWKLWEANFELPAETVIISDPLDRTFHPSDNWQWSETIRLDGKRSHYSAMMQNVSQHSVDGVFPYILPVNGTLIQDVYLLKDNIPDSLTLRIKTGYLLGHQFQQQPVTVQARWTKLPEEHIATENRPSNFWAGTLPPQDGWHSLAVNLCDLGLCGRNRIIQRIEYIVTGSPAWFGQTIIRRPQVEMRGTKKYNVFSVGDEVAFDIAVHNFSHAHQQYTLDITMSDYAGTQLLHSAYKLDIAAKSDRHEKLILNPGNKRYFIFEYALRRGETLVYHGYCAAAIIVPNRTGRKTHSKFGMMYWDQPGQDTVELYEKLGVKLMVIFPEMQRLHLFDRHKFDIMPMLWALPTSPQEIAKLQQDVRPYLDAGQHLFSNFWETDLRVPAEIFAPRMHQFYQTIKHVEPLAIVGIGGLAGFNVAYLYQILQMMNKTSPAGTFFDFIAVMLYNTPSPPEFSGIDQETAAFLELLQAGGTPNTEIWNVEWSYFENLNLDMGVWLNTGVPRTDLASYTIRHHLFGFAAGISRMVPGTTIYFGKLPLSKNYGHSMIQGGTSVMHYDLMPLPLLPAYSVMTRMLEGKEYVANLSRHPNVICQAYQATDESYQALGSSKTVLVVWSLFGTEQFVLPISNNAGQTTTLTLLNMVGDETEHATYNGMLHLSVTPEPTYILLDQDAAEIITFSKKSSDQAILSALPEDITIAPGRASTLKLTYRVFNPGWNALQGSIEISHPNWINIINKEIHYPDETRQQLATAALSATDEAEIWLGREQSADIVYEVVIPENIIRKTYYEQFELTQQPSFQIIASFKTGGNVIANAITTVRMLPPLDVKLRPVLASKDAMDSPALRVQIKNNTLDDRQGTLRVKVYGRLRPEPEQLSFSLSAGETHTYAVSLKGTLPQPEVYTFESVDTSLNRRTEQITLQTSQNVPIAHYRKNDGYLSSFGIGEGFVVEVLLQDHQGGEIRQCRGFAFRPAVKATTPILIDGQLDDWTKAVPLFVHPEGRLSGLTFWAKDYGKQMQWTGLDDFASAWQMMWDESFLYLAIKTFDDRFIPQTNLGSFWNGDTISFQIDPLPDLTDASIIPAQRDLRQIHTFDIGLSQEGPRIRRKYATQEKFSGIMTSINSAIHQVHDGVVYELAIPWDELTPLRPETGGWIGFSLVFYEDDGNGRETRTNWFGGSGGNGLAREPRLMGDVHFVD